MLRIVDVNTKTARVANSAGAAVKSCPKNKKHIVLVVHASACPKTFFSPRFRHIYLTTILFRQFYH